ncbi:MAG: hypothetical protein RMK90_05705, partial [Acetobacteraceae bacterium]|nr:hypothetical protein [Acetobacteraceae bacterium]
MLHAPGFETIDPWQHRDRSARTLGSTARLRGLSAGCGVLEWNGRADTVPRLSAWAAGPDWRCDAELGLLAWDRLIREELELGEAALFAGGLGALEDVLTTGILACYVTAHWRYALFARYPLALHRTRFPGHAGARCGLPEAGVEVRGARVERAEIAV